MHIKGTEMFPKTDLVFGAADTVKSFTLLPNLNGILPELDIAIPVWTNNPTCIGTLERADGTVAWTGAAVSKGSGVTYYAQFPDRCIFGGEVIKATLSVAPGGTGGTVSITPWGRE